MNGDNIKSNLLVVSPIVPRLVIDFNDDEKKFIVPLGYSQEDILYFLFASQLHRHTHTLIFNLIEFTTLSRFVAFRQYI